MIAPLTEAELDAVRATIERRRVIARDSSEWRMFLRLHGLAFGEDAVERLVATVDALKRGQDR